MKSRPGSSFLFQKLKFRKSIILKFFLINIPKNLHLSPPKVLDKSLISYTFQVIPSHGNPQMRQTLFDSYLFKYCSVKCQSFHRVFEKTSQQTYLHQKNYLKSFPDACKSHKTSTNLSDRAYFQ